MAEINSIEDFIALDDRVHRYKRTYDTLRGVLDSIGKEPVIGVGTEYGRYHIEKEMGEYYIDILRGFHTVISDTIGKLNHDFVEKIK